MSIFSILKQLLTGLTASAEDPRLVYADAFQGHREVMGKVRRARGRLAASREELEARLTEARGRQQRLETGASQDPFAVQLRQIVGEELRALEDEVKELEQEEKELGMVEQRLSVQEETFTTRQAALAARHSAAEARMSIHRELEGVSEELANLGVVLENAEQRARNVHSKASDIEYMAGLGSLVGSRAFRDPSAQQLAGRFSSEAGMEESAHLKRLLGSGFKALLELEYEHRQLQAVLERKRETDPISITYIPILAEETYQQGLSALQDSISLVQAIRSPQKEKLEERILELEKELQALGQEGTDAAKVRTRFREEEIASTRDRLEIVQRQQLRVEELLHQCGQCVAALNRTRIEVAALKVEGGRTSVDEVTASLRKTIDEAREVQEELRGLGL